jgi:HipA-like protein
MTDTLTVILDDAVAGTVSRLQGGRLRFDYDDAYRAIPSATSLSVSMPKLVRTHSDGVITPWLWGLLPDNEAVLARWARDFHTSASPFALLSTPIGHDCAARFGSRNPARLMTSLRSQERSHGSASVTLRSACESCKKTQRRGWVETSVVSSASPAPKRRPRCCFRRGVGHSHRGQPRPATSSSQPSPGLMNTT